MNLQHAANNPGKFHEMRAKATKFDVKEGDYGLYALGTLKDELGNEEKVLFAVKKGETLVDAATAKQLCIWGVKYDANTDNFKAYFNSTVAKQLQGQQGAQQPAQSTNPQYNAPQGEKEPGWGIVLRTRVVCAYIASGKEPLAEDVEYWMEYIKTGIDASLPGNKPTENQSEERRPATDGDIPY